MRTIKLTLFLLFFMAAALFAQEVSGEELQAGAEVAEAALQALGLALNAGGVWFLVFLVNKYRPLLREKAPHWIPIIAMLAGPLLNAFAAVLLQYAGMEIDFSPLIAALAGTSAIAFDQVGRQYRKRFKPSRLPA